MIGVTVLSPVKLIVKAQAQVTPLTFVVKPPVKLLMTSRLKTVQLVMKVGGPYAIVYAEGQTPLSENTALVHNQTTPSSEWSVPLPWGRKAASIQLEVDGAIWIPDVIETSAERVVLVFAMPTVGILTVLRS